MGRWDDYYKQLREDIKITDVIGEFFQVQGRKCRCPFHDDKNASLVIFPDTNTWKCMACGKGGSTIDFVKEYKTGGDFVEACKWLSNHFNIAVPSAQTNGSTKDEKRKTKNSRLKQEMDKIQQLMDRQNGRHKNQAVIHDESKIVTFDYEVAESFVSSDNSFCRCMRELFDEEVVERVCSEYLLGVFEYKGHDDCVLFPSIDRNYELRDLKIQWYYAKREDSRFFHCDKDVIAWWSGLEGVKEKLPEGMKTDKDCLFGEHLLTKYPDRTVVLVESPKNACIGAALCPEMVWVATGNKTQMKPRVLEALRGRDVLVIPDRDAIAEWGRVISDLGSLANFRMSGFQEAFKDLGDEKYDIADFIISRAEAQRTQSSIRPTN